MNHDPNQRISLQKAKAIDVEGNEFQTDEIHIGTSWHSNTAYTDTPIKTTVLFKKVLPSTQILKLVPISYYHEKHIGTIEFEYKDIPVDWK